MGRLTFRHDCPGLDFHGKAESCEPINCIDEYSKKALSDIVTRLAAYEDLFERLGLDITDPAQVDELSALVEAQDEGLLLKMPCKPGTELFGHCRIRGANPISRGYFYPPHIPKLGVDAWLTRAEAEAALGGGGDG